MHTKEDSIPKAVIKASIEALKGYGFKCENPQSEKIESKAINSVGLKVVFDPEPATGMAAFSQETVQLSIMFYEPDIVEMRVRYNHHGRGSNGVNRTFVALIEKDVFNEGHFVSLIDTDLFTKAIHHYHNKKNDPIKP